MGYDVGHMTRLDTLDRNNLYDEVAELAREQGIADAEGWATLCDEVISAHLDLAELDPDQDLESIREQLKSKWEMYKEAAHVESKDAVDEDPRAPHI